MKLHEMEVKGNSKALLLLIPGVVFDASSLPADSIKLLQTVKKK